MTTLPQLSAPTFEYESPVDTSELPDFVKAEVPKSVYIVPGDEIDFHVRIDKSSKWEKTAQVTSETKFPMVFSIPKEIFSEGNKPAEAELLYIRYQGGGGNDDHSSTLTLKLE
ncbi:hypothetical protein [Pseudomonas sp. Q11]|uniref:hypothetical protein n=1 Tax=Pseudomonas sp. Q11 TaxID=2968470 RepID=UPI00210B2298|nr:hypothetical protein [Pseudomonas sp. Q11]MCQ6259182.1 hypothetical protein [Pseudomonas sp. Q11]